MAAIDGPCQRAVAALVGLCQLSWVGLDQPIDQSAQAPIGRQPQQAAPLLVLDRGQLVPRQQFQRHGFHILFDGGAQGAMDLLVAAGPGGQQCRGFGIAVADGGEQGAALAAGFQGRVRALIEQPAHHLAALVESREVECRLSPGVAYIDGSALGEQHAGDLELPLAGGTVQGGIAFGVRGASVGALGQQLFENAFLAQQAGNADQGPAAVDRILVLQAFFETAHIRSCQLSVPFRQFQSLLAV